MSRVPLFEREPYRTECGTEILSVGEADGRPFAVLSDTILYPEGGGQPADRGFLNGAPVLDVQRRGGEIRHLLERPVAPGPATLRLDWDRRFDHMQQHTGQHLLTAVAQDRFRWSTTAFHLGDRVSDVELAVPKLPPGALRELEDAVAAEIRAARPVTARRVTAAEFAGLPVRTRGLPEGHDEEIRLVEIAGVDLNTCGGTHLRSTAEIEVLALLGTEPIRGGTRLFYAAGGRVRRRLAGHEERSAALRKLLGAPDEGLVAAAAERLGKLKDAERILRGKEEQEAREAAAALARDASAVVSRTFVDRPAAFLSSLSKEFLAAAPAKAGLFASTSGGQSFFHLVAGPDSPPDGAAAGREGAALLRGRGGGSGSPGGCCVGTRRQARSRSPRRTTP
ncbi:MAG TPA: alanyl-tRNA editing protein [Thermoanaerobaculia bacterium]|nr:alanyl-tRNA editing protein [Thermoanaerobaculia bacterium]